MKKIPAIACALLFCCLSTGQTKEVCISIDDLPVVSYGLSDTTFQSSVFHALITSLRKNQIPAIGFVIGKKLLDSSGINRFQVELLTRWRAQGWELGNHTFSHPDYNTVSWKEYVEDIRKGEELLTEVLPKSEQQTRYFRYPFLHVGDTRSKADSLEHFLADQGYTTAPVTVDNDDYLFAHAFHRAKIRHDSALAGRIGRDYIAYMEKKLQYFERQARRLFGRDIRQILLIHASWLNAEYVGALADMYRTNGYRFISMKRALEDDVYRTPVTVYGKWGISWIDRWALSWGKTGSFFNDEPDVPEYVKRLLTGN